MESDKPFEDMPVSDVTWDCSINSQIVHDLELSDTIETKLKLCDKIENYHDCFRTSSAVQEDVFLDIWRAIYSLGVFSLRDYLLVYDGSMFFLEKWTHSDLSKRKRLCIPSISNRAQMLINALQIARENLEFKKLLSS